MSKNHGHDKKEENNRNGCLLAPPCPDKKLIIEPITLFKKQCCKNPATSLNNHSEMSHKKCCSWQSQQAGVDPLGSNNCKNIIQDTSDGNKNSQISRCKNVGRCKNKGVCPRRGQENNCGPFVKSCKIVNVPEYTIAANDYTVLFKSRKTNVCLPPASENPGRILWLTAFEGCVNISREGEKPIRGLGRKSKFNGTAILQAYECEWLLIGSMPGSD